MTFKCFFKRLMARIPEPLPRNPESMERFVKDVLSLYDLPETPDYKSSLVKTIHGLSQSTHKAPKYFFYSHLARFEVMRAAVVSVTELEKQKTQERQKQAATTPKPESPPEPLQDACVQAAAAPVVPKA